MVESQNIEWKEAWRDEYLRWICGFANAEGGTLIVGRNDKGQAVGVDNAKRLLAELPNKIRDVLGLVVPVRLVEEGGQWLIEIEVEPSPVPISFRGEYHVRSGSTKQELKGPALSAFLLRKMGRHWDGAPVADISVTDLDPLALRRFFKHARRGKRLSPEALAAEPEELLERLHLTEGGMLKRAALLLFHEDPERWFTGAYVKIGRFREREGVVYHDEFHGGLFQQLDECLDTLLTKYLIAWITYEGVQRVETYPVPREALREAIINALIHKDYTSGAPIQIRVYDNQLVIWNSGALPPNWTSEKLMEAHSSEPRNPDLANTFYRTGLIEAWGQGFQRILQECREAGTSLPRAVHDGAGLGVEWNWASPEALTPPVTDPVTTTQLESRLESRPELRPESVNDRILLTLENAELGKAEVAAALGHSSVSGTLNASIRDLLTTGLIERTIPDKPQSRLQKYRLTESGRASLLRNKTKS